MLNNQALQFFISHSLFFRFIAYWSFGAETCYSIGAGLMVLPLLMLILTKVDIPQQVDNKKTSEDKKTN